ncbi:MAG: hypothetical protein A2Z34_00660 [Planctomycetes bacterium RBG_16_59_8]|nr:MAG: hypothetical protein A2Z34_00660 [Planctomycetes bacterium RBG_16_59_8]
MESLAKIQSIEHLPTNPQYEKLPVDRIRQQLLKANTVDTIINANLRVDTALIALAPVSEHINVPDSLFDAYEKSFANSDISLFEHYSDVLERGEQSTAGFISNLKGKLFEIHLKGALSDAYPGYEFELANNPTNPGWDIKGVNTEDHSEILVQSKMGGENYASDVIDRMREEPDTMFAVSEEIHNKIIEIDPDLADQIIPSGVTNYDFTNDTSDNLGTLASNMGIDIPDGIQDILSNAGEIILGIRLIVDLLQVQSDFKNVSAEDKAKISALKTLVLMGRFGVSTVCTTVASAAGTALVPVPILGTLVGAGTGFFTAMMLNKELSPYMSDMALGLLSLTQDDLFYFKNKHIVNKLAYSFMQTGAELA